MNSRENFNKSIYILNSIKKSGTTILCPSSCDYRDDFQNLEFDNVILCSKQFEQSRIIGKVFCIKMNESELLGRLCKMGVKLNAVISLHVRYALEDCRQIPFFNKMMPLFADDFLYFSNLNIFTKKNLDIPMSMESITIPNYVTLFQNPSSRLKEKISGWRMNKINTPPTTLTFPHLELVLNRESIWGKVEQFDMTFMKLPTNPRDSGEGYNDRCIAISLYLRGLGVSERKVKYFYRQQEYKQSILPLLEEAAVNKLESVACIPFSDGGYEIIHEQLRHWTGEFPKEIHIYHLHQNDFEYFYKLPEAKKAPRINKYEIKRFIEKCREGISYGIQNTNEILNIIEHNGYTFTKNELFEIFNIENNYEMGERHTPDNIAELIAKIGEIYDPSNVIDICCGTGNILSYFKNIKDKKGIEINKEIAKISQLINKTTDIEVSNIMEYDFKNKKYDLVICHPPFGLTVNGRRNGEHEIIKKGLEILNNKGVAIFIILTNTLTKSNELMEFRKYLLLNFAIDMIVDLPTNIYPHTKVKTSILVIRNGEKKSDIFMPSFEKNTNKIINEFNTHSGNFYLPLSDIDSNLNLDKESYLDEAAAKKIRAGHTLLKLSDIANVIIGEKIDSNNSSSDGIYSVFEKKDKKINNIRDTNSILRNGDFILPLIVNKFVRHRMKVYDEEGQMEIVSSNFAIIRAVTEQDRNYLKKYLETEDWQILLKTRIDNSFMQRINVKKLKELTIPKLSDSDLEMRILETLKINGEDRYYTIESQNHLKKGEYDNARNLIEEVKDSELKEAHLQNINNAEALAKKDKELEEKNKELNNLIAMFAHNFLGTLQCIRSNAEHENNPNIHLKTVKMMGGALTAFSIISADDDKLVEQLKQDTTGEADLLQCLTNNLALTISQLLSKTNKDKIINLYLKYLQKTGKIPTETNTETLRSNKENRTKWQNLQHQWDDEFNTLFSEQVEITTLKKWINDNFFAIEIIGFDKYPIHFNEYGVTDSIFLVVLMETLVNAFKYIDVKVNQPLILRLCKVNNAYQLSCQNPTRQESYRGTHKGMDFLQTIAKKLNGEFINESTENNFKTTFIIPAELLE